KPQTDDTAGIAIYLWINPVTLQPGLVRCRLSTFKRRKGSFFAKKLVYHIQIEPVRAWFGGGFQAGLVDQTQVAKSAFPLAAVQHSQKVQNTISLLCQPPPPKILVASAPEEPGIPAIDRLLVRAGFVLRFGRIEFKRSQVAVCIRHLVHQMKHIAR